MKPSAIGSLAGLGLGALAGRILGASEAAWLAKSLGMPAGSPGSAVAIGSESADWLAGDCKLGTDTIFFFPNLLIDRAGVVIIHTE